MGQTWPLFVLFSSFSQYNDKHSTKFDYKWKKYRFSGGDSKPGPQDGRRRRILCTIAAHQTENIGPGPGCLVVMTSDKSSLVARYFISLQTVNMNYFDTTDLCDLQTGFHSIDFSADSLKYQLYPQVLSFSVLFLLSLVLLFISMYLSFHFSHFHFIFVSI